MVDPTPIRPITIADIRNRGRACEALRQLTARVEFAGGAELQLVAEMLEILASTRCLARREAVS